MMTPDPEPQEWVLTSPVPRTEPAEKKKSKQARKKTLCWKTHTHTQIKVIFGTYIALLKFFKRFINTS